MSPRRNKPPRPSHSGRTGWRRAPAEPLDVERARRGVHATQEYADGEFQVRHIPGGSSGKTYRCPGCQQEIRPGVAHVVAWPQDWRGDASDRRHWHTACWRARDRRAPGGRLRGGRPR